jgi:hypothetical protein
MKQIEFSLYIKKGSIKIKPEEKPIKYTKLKTAN